MPAQRGSIRGSFARVVNIKPHHFRPKTTALNEIHQHWNYLSFIFYIYYTLLTITCQVNSLLRERFFGRRPEPLSRARLGVLPSPRVYSIAYKNAIVNTFCVKYKLNCGPDVLLILGKETARPALYTTFTLNCLFLNIPYAIIYIQRAKGS